MRAHLSPFSSPRAADSPVRGHEIPRSFSMKSKISSVPAALWANEEIKSQFLGVPGTKA